MIDVDQIFVRNNSAGDVVEALRAALTEFGFELSNEGLPPTRDFDFPEFKPVRHFLVSEPIDSWVCVLESRGGDRDLARAMSKQLKTEVVWLSYSTTTEEVDYSVFKDGDAVEDEVIRPREPPKRRVIAVSGARPATSGEQEITGAAEELYKKHGLPCKFTGYEHLLSGRTDRAHFRHVNFRSNRAVVRR